jgi:hypothetical protein
LIERGDFDGFTTSDENGTARMQATLVISVWYEAGSPAPFRARLTSGSGESSNTTISYAASPGAVLSEVSEWLDGLPKPEHPVG